MYIFSSQGFSGKRGSLQVAAELDALVAEQILPGTGVSLDAFWSVDNTKTEGSPTDVDIGELGGSFYEGGGSDRLYIMGDADIDTGEFDAYVTLHEWGHFVEENY